MNKMIMRLIIVLGFVGLLSACSNTFRSNVMRFNDLSQPHGETVTIVPADPAKNTSLEFATYAHMVGNYLAQQGYKPAGKNKADLIVSLDYSVDSGKVMVRGYSFGYGYGYGYGFGGYGGYGGYGYFGGYDPFYGYGSPFGSDIRSYVNYTRKLTMAIRPNAEGEQNLFEGTVESVGRSKDLPKLMPHMVQAMFTNFPGVNGVTDKVVIKLDEKK